MVADRTVLFISIIQDADRNSKLSRSSLHAHGSVIVVSIQILPISCEILVLGQHMLTGNSVLI